MHTNTAPPIEKFIAQNKRHATTLDAPSVMIRKFEDANPTSTAQPNFRVPRISPRFARTFLSAIQHAAGKMTNQPATTQTKDTVSRGIGGPMPDGGVHGSAIRKLTGFPRQVAASIRIGTSGASGQTPFHAARASKAIGGIHSAAADSN